MIIVVVRRTFTNWLTWISDFQEIGIEYKEKQKPKRKNAGEILKLLSLLPMLTLALILVQANSADAAWVVREDDRVYIEDLTGERWDVTEAEQAGFIPNKFQYGIGRNAFTPLDDGDFSEDHSAVSSYDRIIGVSVADEAHAYSVNRLRRHEIANTTIAGKPITAGY